MHYSLPGAFEPLRLYFTHPKVLAIEAPAFAPAPVTVNGLCNVVRPPRVGPFIGQGNEPWFLIAEAVARHTVKVPSHPDIGLEPLYAFFSASDF